MKVVLLTGCSSGIGAATAGRLARHGHIVYATARQPDTLAGLTAGGCRALPLDVTDEASMQAAVRQVLTEQGRLDVLVNNAGYGLYGPVEQLAPAELRRQFETNLFGLVRLCQLVLPGMRERRAGRIVNVSSMGGRTTLPGGGAYHASKYAVEAISDALRIEVRRFGIDVVLIEPGVVRTPWSEQALRHQAAAGGAGEPGGQPDEGRPSGDQPDDPYADYKRAVSESFERAYRGPLARLSLSPEAVARVIVRACEVPRPRTRYLISPLARTLVTAKRLLPDRAYDRLLKQQYRLP
ncbi:MAG TPA: SDR family NAD(P)-dependent oxidoreductase [Jatrophihabitans sp.]|nr:SDR family NAD(P)-dependent oxidoreductase [Jatrophihabitans sp.]